MEQLKAPWDDLVSSIEQDRITPPGFQPLRLLLAANDGAERIQPERDRSMVLVDSALRDVFRQLVRGRARWPLLLHGPPGVGKTMAVLCLCDYLLRPSFRTVDQLTQEVYNLDAYIWEVARAKRFVVVDEVGQGDATADKYLREYRALKRFCDCREQYANRCAIYVSNLGPDALERVYDKRIVDRITCGQVFELTGDSRRRDGNV